MRLVLLAFLIPLGCGGDETGDDCAGCTADAASDPDACAGCELACNASVREVAGTELEFSSIFVPSDPATCDHRVLSSAADVADAFPNDDAPSEVAGADFAVDRVVLASSNPMIQFVVDDGEQLVLGEELLCRGAAPSCMAYLIAGTTRTAAVIDECPYRGPDPCLAP